jgi:hypothetical protein
MEAQAVTQEPKVSVVWIIEDNDAYSRTTSNHHNECRDMYCGRAVAYRE